MTSFGRYHLERKLGAGGMAEVWLARQDGVAGASRQVVIKRVLPAFSEQPEFVRLFVAEAQLSMQLTHGNVVQVFDFGEFDGQYFLAMEWVDGVSLRQLLDGAQRAGLAGLPAPIVVLIVVELCKALHYAHTRRTPQGKPLQVVHRDVSLDNVLISWEGQVKLTDFGIARAEMEGRERTSPNVFKGRFDFAAPEQARAEPVSPQSDLYSVGVVMAELLVGENPVLGRAYEIAAGHERAPRFPAGVVDDLLAETIDRCTEPLPAARPPSAQALQQVLQGWLTQNAALATVTALPQFLGWLWPDEVDQRGLPAERSRAFDEWLTSWQPKQATFPSPERLVSEPSSLPGPTRRVRRVEPAHRPSKGLWIALGAGVGLAVLVVGVTMHQTEVSAPPKVAVIYPPPLGPAKRAVAARPPAPPPPPVVVDRERVGPGQAQLSQAHGRQLEGTEGIVVGPAATLALVQTGGRRASFFATFFDTQRGVLGTQDLVHSLRVPDGAASATVWAVQNPAFFSLNAEPMLEVTSATGRSTRQAVKAALIEVAPAQRFTFSALDPSRRYAVEVEGDASVVAVLRPPVPQWLSSGQTTFDGARAPVAQALLGAAQQRLEFQGARELWLTVLHGASSKATVQLADESTQALPAAVLAPIDALPDALAVAELEKMVRSLERESAARDFDKWDLALAAHWRLLERPHGDHWMRSEARAWLDRYTPKAIARHEQEAADRLIAAKKYDLAMRRLDECLRRLPTANACRVTRATVLSRVGLLDEAARDDALLNEGDASAASEVDLVSGLRDDAAPSDVRSALDAAFRCTARFPRSVPCQRRVVSAASWLALHQTPAPHGSPPYREVAQQALEHLVELAPEESTTAQQALERLASPATMGVTGAMTEALWVRTIRSRLDELDYATAASRADECLRAFPASWECRVMGEQAKRVEQLQQVRSRQ